MTQRFDVRIGINPIGWSNDDLPELGGDTPLETALSEGAQIGYEGFELGNKFPREPAALKTKLDEYGLACVSGWYSGQLAGATVEAEIERVGLHLDLLAKNGAAVLVYGEVRDSVQGAIKTPLSKRPQFRKESDWQAYGERLTAFGRYLLRHGVRLAYHHHMGAYCETPAEVDTLMRITGEEVDAVRHRPHGLRRCAAAGCARGAGEARQTRVPCALQRRAAASDRARACKRLELPRIRAQRCLHRSWRWRHRLQRRCSAFWPAPATAAGWW